MSVKEGTQNLLVPELERWPADRGPIMELSGAEKSFGTTRVLRGVDLRVDAGSITVVIGASGSGKSVLIKLLNALLFADGGQVRLFGQDPREVGHNELTRIRKRIGTLFQNYALFDSLTVAENVAFPLVNHQAASEEEARRLAVELMESLDLGHAVDMYPSSLSGGMKKRVALARAIVARPEVLLLDEPTTGLDPIMMEFVDDMVRRITDEYKLTALLISHDMASTFRLADSIAVLHEGRIIAQDEPAAIRRSQDERVRALVSASDKTAVGEPGGAPAEAPAEAERGEPEAAVVVRDLRKSFDGREVLRGVNLRAPLGQITVLIGGSGSGKSVLMKHVLGLLRPDSGSATVLGRDVTELDAGGLAALRTEVGMLFQHAALFDSMSVRENVLFPLVERRKGLDRAEAGRLADEVIEKLRLTELAHRQPATISNGQQKRVSLARALVTRPRMMIYDEPTTGQDPILCTYVEEMIVEAHAEFDLTSLIISHDMASTFRVGDHVAMLYKGEIIAEGPPRSLLTSSDERVREFVFAADVAEDRREGGERAAT